MAVDDQLLHDAARSGIATLRLYRWAPACLSFGRHESALGRYDRAEIERRGLDVVRRPTGGRAVWHEHEVTYAVAAPVAAFGSLRDTYCAIHERLAAALRSIGAAATLAPARPPVRLTAGPAACFAAAVGGEVVVDGRKVVGSAQVRSGNAFLQHGSILLAGSQAMVAAVSRRPTGLTGSTTLAEVLGRSVSFEEVADAVVRAWNAPFHRTVGASARLPVYRDPAWTWRR